MPRVAVLLVYEPVGGSPLTVAHVSDGRVINEVARAALHAVEVRAQTLAEADAILGELEQAEADRLRRILAVLVPDLQFRETPLYPVV